MRMLVVVLVGCGAASPAATPQVAAPVAPRAATPACLADDLGPLHDVATLDMSCREDGRSCRESCERGDATGCLLHAYALQQAENGEADAAFVRACKLGLANACTNHAARLWHRTDDRVCSRRLFERACEVREPFGCGMLGRLLAFDAKTPELKAQARAYFDRSCSDLGAVICRMYAFHLEQGHLGASGPATVKALMLRACQTGDTDACGHETAGETFR